MYLFITSSATLFIINEMPSPVKLYVYDLSNGIAKAMSMQVVGRQIDGIWQAFINQYKPSFSDASLLGILLSSSSTRKYSMDQVL